MKKVLTATDIAELLGVCEKTVYGLIRQALATNNMFKVIKVEGYIKFQQSLSLIGFDSWDGM